MYRLTMLAMSRVAFPFSDTAQRKKKKNHQSSLLLHRSVGQLTKLRGGRRCGHAQEPLVHERDGNVHRVRLMARKEEEILDCLLKLATEQEDLCVLDRVCILWVEMFGAILQ